MSEHKTKFNTLKNHKELIDSSILGGTGFLIVKWQSETTSQPFSPSHHFTSLLQRQLNDAKIRCINIEKESTSVDFLRTEVVGNANSNENIQQQNSHPHTQVQSRNSQQYRELPAGRSHYELKQDDQLLASEQMRILMEYVDPFCSAYFSSLPHGTNNYNKVCRMYSRKVLNYNLHIRVY
jgi:hypothetical protein